MNHPHADIVTPNTSTDNARNRPVGLPRRQRIGAGLASAVISAVLLAGVVVGMTDTHDDAQALAARADASINAA